jgi:hypothetical protein
MPCELKIVTIILDERTASILSPEILYGLRFCKEIENVMLSAFYDQI